MLLCVMTHEMCLSCTNGTYLILILKKHKCTKNISGHAARPVVFPHQSNTADSQLGNSTIMEVIQNNYELRMKYPSVNNCISLYNPVLYYDK